MIGCCGWASVAQECWDLAAMPKKERDPCGGLSHPLGIFRRQSSSSRLVFSPIFFLFCFLSFSEIKQLGIGSSENRKVGCVVRHTTWRQHDDDNNGV
jgi:hypothetical protein